MRKKLFKWHSYTALITLLPLLIISITGSILVFKVELDSLLRPAHMLVNAAPDAARVSLDSMMSKVLTQNIEFELGGWELFDNHSRSDAAYLIKRGTEEWYKVYINQYTGELLSQPYIMGHYLTDWLLELHYTFLLHLVGTSFGFVMALIMLFLGISGIILYKKFWSKLLTFRIKAATRMLLSDIHKFTGITSSPMLIVIAATGAYWNIASILHEVDEHPRGGHVFIEQPLHAAQISFESLKIQAETHIPSFQAGYLAMPHKKDLDIVFYGDVDSHNPLHSEYASTVGFDKLTGELIYEQDIRQASILMVFLDSFRKLHFGYFGGLLSRVLWCMVGLMPLILGLTGIYMYALRQKLAIFPLRTPKPA
ncbi:PepSY-associated TM helix [Shewanella denitrificans OS217]|uniref:PepSY-associated TM helix n=1 Tax=Shewanella denitrificans (strain OS217 / ATCC BAA-1090 / DSM 15013) TaxID=318161 RepID=Q12JN3_SHEDO|nr:PepSY-associated TM helix domain-containing protein [Shewanella denitrificans]ABE56343.1 PepSY-associated TM helix [Shewanella denitrificans OS217]